MSDDDERLIEARGWIVECYSPLEIRHEDGSFASLNAAEILVMWLKENPEED
jgi:hypothetical protein